MSVDRLGALRSALMACRLLIPSTWTYSRPVLAPPGGRFKPRLLSGPVTGSLVFASNARAVEFPQRDWLAGSWRNISIALASGRRDGRRAAPSSRLNDLSPDNAAEMSGRMHVEVEGSRVQRHLLSRGQLDDSRCSRLTPTGEYH